MTRRKILLMLSLALASMIIPIDSFAEPPVLASQLFQTFEYQEEDVPALLRFHRIGKKIFLEQSGMAYWAAEVYLDKPSSLVCAPVGTTVAAKVRRFSGFSNAGQFWDDGMKASITVSGKGTLTLTIDGENPIQAVRDSRGRSIHALPNQSAPEQTALMGSWTNADESAVAVFRRDGTMLLMTAEGGSPAEVYFGTYSVADQHIRYTAERMGWGGMPHEGTLSFSREGNTLSLRSVDDDPSILGRASKCLELNHTPGLPIM